MNSREADRLADIINDFTIDHDLRIHQSREKYGQPEHQKIPVGDDILLGIVLAAWTVDALEAGFCIDWKNQLVSKTQNQDFKMLTDDELLPYTVRASILLENTSEYAARKQEEKSSRSYFQT